jgi:radical SAM protein with 4Fe4S-binding SPASM domain
MRCAHCYPEASPDVRDPELSPEQHFAAIRSFADAGVNCVVLSGGEVLVLRHATDLIAAIAAAGMSPYLCTNGSLITEKSARELKKAGLLLASVSVDGAEAETHDGLRLYPGAFDKAMRGMRLLKEAGITVMADYTATRANRADIGALRELVKANGAESMNMKRFRPLGRGQHNVDSLQLSLEEYREVIDEYLDPSSCQSSYACTDDPAAYAYVRVVKGQDVVNPQSLASSLGCLAGHGWFGVLPNGDVTPCPLLGVPIGNLTQHDLPTLFRTSPEIARILDRDDRGGACGTCPERSQCGGCRAHALGVHGDYLAEDPYCLLVQLPSKIGVTN